MDKAASNFSYLECERSAKVRDKTLKPCNSKPGEQFLISLKNDNRGFNLLKTKRGRETSVGVYCVTT